MAWGCSGEQLHTAVVCCRKHKGQQALSAHNRARTCSSASRSSRTITLPSSSARQSAPGAGKGGERVHAGGRGGGAGSGRRCSNPRPAIRALRDGPSPSKTLPTWTEGGLLGCRSRLQTGQPPRATPPLGGRSRHGRSLQGLGSSRERTTPAGRGARCCCQGRACTHSQRALRAMAVPL